MIRINDIIDKVIEHNPDADTDIIDRAYIYSAQVHEGQVRLSGEPYLSHPLEVAGILADMKLDPVSIASGLLHDVVEDTHATTEDLENFFGNDVIHIVSGVTKLSTISFNSAQAQQAENTRKMLLAMADDIRVILIKLADRMHNMRTLQYHKKEEKKRKIAQETLDIYAPIAARLGIYWLRKELEDISFMYVCPDEYYKIKELVNKDKKERENYIATIKGYLKRKMEESNLNCRVLGRYKHFYGIFKKMASQNLSFEEIFDIIAFRIILDTIPQCYEALGLVHSLWQPIDIKFKDYIGRPKPNMYQSLHTTVIGLLGERIEIQIRTLEMDKVANSGIAAHWSYKEGKSTDLKACQTYGWIQNLIENQKNIQNPDEFLENVRIDLFPDEVYVFSPRGEIKALPKGATPVDFAYVIHSEIGDQCAGAKVNGRMVPLHYQLETGHTVEIIVSKNAHPSKDWLNFVKSVRARSRIRQWIKNQEKKRSLSLGKEMCEKVFREEKLNFNEIYKSEKMQNVIKSFSFKNIEDLIISVGYGKITPRQVLGKFIFEPEKDNQSLLDKFINRVIKKKIKTSVSVTGMDDILLKFGKCCNPLPGDTITGYITQGYGITVHRISCKNALKINPERQIDVEWKNTISEVYPAVICVHALDRVGLLADIASNISKNGANISKIEGTTKDDKSANNFFTILVKNTEHLNKVLISIKKIKNVNGVKRITNKAKLI